MREAIGAPVASAQAIDAASDDTDATQPPTIELFLAGVERRAYRFALCELWDRDAALDAVQDSMRRLIERYAERPAAQWPALFFTILRNRATDAKRRRALRRLRGLLVGTAREHAARERALLTVPAHAHDTPEARQTAAEQRRALESALNALPVRQRQAFLMREWQGLNTAETAQALGCSEGTVKQHHFRALRTLRARLSKVWYE